MGRVYEVEKWQDLKAERELSRIDIPKAGSQPFEPYYAGELLTPEESGGVAFGIFVLLLMWFAGIILFGPFETFRALRGQHEQ